MVPLPKIKCSKCSGSGSLRLNPALFETLLALKSVQPAHAGTVLRRIADTITVSAVNNRLELLREMGLVDRSKVGRSFQYFLCKTRSK